MGDVPRFRKSTGNIGMMKQKGAGEKTGQARNGETRGKEVWFFFHKEKPFFRVQRAVNVNKFVLLERTKIILVDLVRFRNEAK